MTKELEVHCSDILSPVEDHTLHSGQTSRVFEIRQQVQTFGSDVKIESTHRIGQLNALVGLDEVSCLQIVDLQFFKGNFVTSQIRLKS